jgi:hypothetical protein
MRESLEMSVTVTVEYQYRLTGRREVNTITETLTVADASELRIRATLRLLHPHWEGLKILKIS